MKRTITPLQMIADAKRRNVNAWNLWREENRHVPVTLNNLDLSSADLRGADLAGADLFGACLLGADLSKSDLSGANLSRADLRSADLCGANLSGAAMRGTCLRKAYLGGANLSGADLSDTDLRYSLIEGAWLDGANLARAFGANRPDIVSAANVGDDELWSAFRHDNGSVTVWCEFETFDSVDACRLWITAGEPEFKLERLAWLAWAEARLEVRS